MFLRTIFFGLFLLVATIDSNSQTNEKMKGVTLVASTDPIELHALEAVKKTNANWVVINPFAFCYSEKSAKIIYNSPRQWWGERPEGIKDAIQKAHQLGFKVLLKPQVWIPGGWVGHVEHDSSKRRQDWRDSYDDYIFQMATIAAATNVEVLCVGTEYDLTVIRDLEYWRELIAKVREQYKGKITYAGNWTHFDQLEIWTEVDYIGIDAYFPLVDAKTPSIDELKTAWEIPKAKVKAIAEKYNKPIIFTEFGYLSVDGCAFEHWKLESKRAHIKTNEEAQANAYRAILESFLPEPWYLGCFLWKWYPNDKANMGEGNIEKDYTPQGKKALSVLKELYGKY